MGKEGKRSMNTLTDLNDILFKSMEKLADDSLSPEELEQELKRSDSISRLAKNITDTADLMLKASKHIHEISGSNIALPMFGDKYE